MASCKLTMIGLYNYDNTLFDGLTLPNGINKQIAVDEILMRAGEFEVNYPDIDFMKLAIEHWGKKHYRTFEKWIDALNIDFEPLYNYDRYEEYEDNRNKANKSDANTTSTGNTNSKTNASSNTNTVSTNDVDLTHSVSAYDAATYQPRDKEVTDGDSTVKGNGVSSSISDDTRTDSENTRMNAAENENIKHTAHLYGNIGVTTSSALLEEYIRVERFNIYEQLADIFVDEFCIGVYS